MHPNAEASPIEARFVDFFRFDAMYRDVLFVPVIPDQPADVHERMTL
jgi:hypothetical protein